MLGIKAVVAAGLAAGSWLPPVAGPVTQPFLAPAGPYAPGHRGVDFAVPRGTLVSAAAPGRVTFAGPVAGTIHAVIVHDLPAGVRSSYSFLARLAVVGGERVREGDPIGWTGGIGPGHGPDVFHFGVRTATGYVDPRPYLRTAAPGVQLAPVEESTPREGDQCGGYNERDLARRPGIHTPALRR